LFLLKWEKNNRQEDEEIIKILHYWKIYCRNVRRIANIGTYIILWKDPMSLMLLVLRFNNKIDLPKWGHTFHCNVHHVILGFMWCLRFLCTCNLWFYWILVVAWRSLYVCGYVRPLQNEAPHSDCASRHQTHCGEAFWCPQGARWFRIGTLSPRLGCRYALLSIILCLLAWCVFCYLNCFSVLLWWVSLVEWTLICR
jgi:hypothetical protein